MKDKVSSYQKLKDKNKHLEQVVFVLLEQPDSAEAIQIKALHKFRFNAEKAVMFGSPTKVN